VPTLVVAALSARLLAESARRAGWSVLALDIFGDVDTVGAAASWQSIGTAQALHIDAERFLAGLRAAAANDAAGWIAGAGFEARLDLLEAGAGILPLFGNDRAVQERVRAPRRFFATLDDLRLAHPETRFAPPADPQGWLLKDFATSGAWRIRRATAAHAALQGRAYFQRALAGRPMSVLFLADGARARSVGINELIVTAHGTRPYVYRGAIGPVCDVPQSAVDVLAQAVADLTRAFRLRGLCSMDFLCEGDAVHILEINARPSASMALYDGDVPQGLAQAHIDACAGRLPDLPKAGSGAVRGEQTVFARRATRIDAGQARQLLASGCHDVPQPGTRVAAHAPLCSVAARAHHANDVRAALALHEAAVLSMVQNRNEADHHAS
jgi:uncharacterized protein